MSPPISIFRNALDFVSDGIVISDPVGSVHFVNRQIPRLFGYSAEEILGASVETLVPDRFKNKHSKHRAHFATAPYERPMNSGLALMGRRKDGSEFPVQIRLGPLQQGDSLFVLAAIRDVTARTHTVTETSLEFSAANDSSKRAYGEKDALSHASHGVRGILTTLGDAIRQLLHSLAMFNAMLVRHRQLDDHMLSHAIRGQTDAIQSIASLVDSFLHFRRPDSGTVYSPYAAVPSAQSPERFETSGSSGERSSKDPRARKVLVLIDDPGCAQAACRLLSVTGHRVTLARSLEEARAAALFRRDIDVLLTEDRLADGTEAAQLIAALREELDRRIEAIVMSDGMASLSGERLILDTGLRLLRRPVLADELLRTLEEL